MENEQETEGKGLVGNIKEHLVVSVAGLAEATPIFAFSEKVISGMSDQVSLDARYLATAITFAGSGWAYNKGRNLWRKRFDITQKSREWAQQKHDMIYGGLYSAALTGPIYLATGETDPWKLGIGTLCAGAIGAFNGGVVGYTLDLFKDLMGLEDSVRIPKLISSQSSGKKKGLAALICAASLAVTMGIYHFTPDVQEISGDGRPGIESVVR